ncbi:MAG: bifunctional methylenetetrahydrofolate dehydrogenase/methenyltetrahydrofolate cyclohydrolase FolD [Planctomycetales bacterium]|nr:bifunctional methylenetetrahydrofolate dehydrogenase/methenyltetrahydrofolate cyclohydrolase FolD [Planctomycetales bacterium]
MSGQLLDGKALAKTIKTELAGEVVEFIENNSTVPKLAAVLVGDDAASDVYVRNKRRACEQVSIESELHRLPADTTQEDLLNLVARLNKSIEVHGILVQLPLPNHIDTTKILDAIHPRKDVDAFHPENVGRLSQGRPRFLPCTPNGVMQILHRHEISTAGKHIAIVGRSDIVGKPLAMMMAQKTSHLGPDAANGTVTLCHSRTTDLASVTRQADILVAAIGVPKFITAEMVKPGAAVIDVGINRTEDGLVGDVDFDAVREVAGAITPVPGGVGPLTVAMLMQNTLTAARLQVGCE